MSRVNRMEILPKKLTWTNTFCKTNHRKKIDRISRENTGARIMKKNTPRGASIHGFNPLGDCFWKITQHVMSSSVTSRVEKASVQYGELSSVQVYNYGHTMASSWAQLSLPYRTLAFSICEVTEELITRWVILSKQSYNGLKLFLEEHSYFHIYVPAISRDISSVFLLLQLFCLNLRCIEVRIQFQK